MTYGNPAHRDLAAAVAALLPSIERRAGAETVLGELAAAKLLAAAASFSQQAAGQADLEQANSALMLTILADRLLGRPDPAPHAADIAQQALAAAQQAAAQWGPDAPAGFAELARRVYHPAGRAGFDYFAAVWTEYNQ